MMVSLSSLSAELLFLLYLVRYVSTSGANTSSAAASPSYANMTSSGDANNVSLVGAATTTISYVSGSAAVESCNLEWANWQSNYADWLNSEIWASGTTTETLFTTTSTLYSTYTLCDGIPRVVVSDDSNYTTVTRTLGFYTPPLAYTYESLPSPSPVVLSVITTVIPILGPVGDPMPWTTSFDTPMPTCKIGPEDCASLYTAASNARFTGGGITTPIPPADACDTVYDIPESSIDYPCYVFIPLVQLVYWPVTLESQDLCVYPDPIDITAMPSNTPVASVFGMNITSDENCYLSYPIAMALFYGNDTIQIQPADILPVPSSNLQSYRGFQPNYGELFAYSFNFADLPPNHVPVLAYEGAASCSFYAGFGMADLPSTCATIYEQIYAPELALPTELVKKYPQWASCDFGEFGLYDPPTALVPVAFLTAPSTASPTTSAAPASRDTITPSPTPVPGMLVKPTAGPGESSTTSRDLDLGSGGDPSTVYGDDVDLSGDLGSSLDSVLGTAVVFGNSGESLAIPASSADSMGSNSILPGQVAAIDGQMVSVLSQGSGIAGLAIADSSAAATAIFTLGDGSVVTSVAGANDSPFIIVGSQTLTAGQLLTTDGAVLFVDGGLLASSEAFTSVAILTANSETITAVEFVDNGSTLIDIGSIGEIAVGGSAIFLTSGVELSAGDSGLVITSAGGITTIPFSGVATSTPLESFTISLSHTKTMPVPSTSKMNGSSRASVGMKALVMWLFVALRIL